MSATSTAEGFDQKQILKALLEIKRGNFAHRMPEDWTGLGGKIADAFNAVAEPVSYTHLTLPTNREV